MSKIPKQKLRFQLESLECLAHPTLEKAAPYLWNIFFRIDGQCMKITERLRLDGRVMAHFSEGSHDNLGTEAIVLNQAIAIPQEVGEWSTLIEPLHLPFFEQKIPAIFGLLSVCMEKGGVSPKGAEAGHQVLNQEAVYAVNKILSEFEPKHIDLEDPMNSAQAYFKKKADPFIKSIPLKVVAAVQKEQNIFQNFLSLVNKDEFVGVHVWTFTQRELFKNNGLLALKQDWEAKNGSKWQIRGQIKSVD